MIIQFRAKDLETFVGNHCGHEITLQKEKEGWRVYSEGRRTSMPPQPSAKQAMKAVDEIAQRVVAKAMAAKGGK